MLELKRGERSLHGGRVVTVAEGFSKHCDMNAEAALINMNIRSNTRNQLSLGDNFAAMLDEENKNIQGAVPDLQRDAVPPKQALDQ